MSGNSADIKFAGGLAIISIFDIIIRNQGQKVILRKFQLIFFANDQNNH